MCYAAQIRLDGGFDIGQRLRQQAFGQCLDGLVAALISSGLGTSSRGALRPIGCAHQIAFRYRCWFCVGVISRRFRDLRRLEFGDVIAGATGLAGRARRNHSGLSRAFPGKKRSPHMAG